MNPFSIASVGMGASVGSGILGTVGSLMTGFGQSAQAKYQAGIARMNAQVERQNAQWALDAGESQALQSGRKTAQIVGAQRSQQAANNLDVNFGSPSQVRTSQTLVGQEEQSNIRLGAARTAYGREIAALGDEASAKMYDRAAKTSKIAGFINAGSSILGAAGSVSAKWLDASRYGIYGGGNPTILGDATYIDNRRHESSEAYG